MKIKGRIANNFATEFFEIFLTYLFYENRTDYWKSNERKFCDFCKCWITDNKPSVQFHENGKNHKINVAKRLAEIGKKSLADEKANNKNNVIIKKMNEAAMKSYMRDISESLDMSSRAINKTMMSQEVDDTLVEAENFPTTSTGSVSKKKQVDPLALPLDIYNATDEEFGPNVGKRAKVIAVNETVVKENSLWCEAKTDEGHTYYWNVKTNDSIWEKPKEGFMSLKEYEKINEIALKQQEETKYQEYKNAVNNADENAAKYKREQHKVFKVKEAKSVIETIEDTVAVKPFLCEGARIGDWQEVIKETRQVDYELPKSGYSSMYVAAVVPLETPVRKFYKEKSIGSLVESGEPKQIEFFKKRPIKTNRSSRQRTDDDN